MDDICTELPVDLINSFLDHLNKTEESINLTVELENDHKLAFLETEIIHHLDGSLSVLLFSERTDKHLSFKSYNPLAHKISVVKILFIQSYIIISVVHFQIEFQEKYI